MGKMVALDAARRRVVPMGSLEARWIVDEDEVEAYIRDAAQQTRMQALMDQQAEARLADEKASLERAELMDAHREAVLRTRAGEGRIK
jgi:hypothetical protein